jgi:hypothetical protein
MSKLLHNGAPCTFVRKRVWVCLLLPLLFLCNPFVLTPGPASAAAPRADDFSGDNPRLDPHGAQAGNGSEAYAPLARAIIGGLLVSAVVTVYLVPAAYLIVHRKQEQAPQEAQARYDLGLGSIVEFSQAELQKTAADIADTDAKYQYRVSQLVLAYTVASPR